MLALRNFVERLSNLIPTPLPNKLKEKIHRKCGSLTWFHTDTKIISERRSAKFIAAIYVLKCYYISLSHAKAGTYILGFLYFCFAGTIGKELIYLIELHPRVNIFKIINKIKIK